MNFLCRHAQKEVLRSETGTWVNRNLQQQQQHRRLDAQAGNNSNSNKELQMAKKPNRLPAKLLARLTLQCRGRSSWPKSNPGPWAASSSDSFPENYMAQRMQILLPSNCPGPANLY